MNVTGTGGERITIALVLVGFVVEMLSDNWQTKPQAQPMDIEVCRDLCWGQELPVKRIEAWACECAVGAEE